MRVFTLAAFALFLTIPSILLADGHAKSELDNAPTQADGKRTLAPGTEIRFSRKGDGTRVKWQKNTEMPELGDAWMDPDGLIWGEKAIAKDGSDMFKYEEAVTYCRRMGARLPTVNEFMRLRHYMGCVPDPNASERVFMDKRYACKRAPNSKTGIWEPVGYTPQVLPGLTEEKNGEVVENVFRIQPYQAYLFGGAIVEFFYGKSGEIDHIPTSNENWVKTQVRCVKDSKELTKERERVINKNAPPRGQSQGPYLIDVRGNYVPIKGDPTGLR